MILAMTTQNSNHPCACGSYAFEVLIHENVGGDKVWQQKTTGCAATTQSTFAPGHDAKLKSLLIADLGWRDLVGEAIAKGSS